MFRITKASAGLENKFSVNDTSGLITMVEMIDYEALPADLNGRVLLEVEAYDLGVPSLSTSINITVEIEVSRSNKHSFTRCPKIKLYYNKVNKYWYVYYSLPKICVHSLLKYFCIFCIRIYI